MTTEQTTGTTVPLSERTIPVHKKDHEGALLINAFTGVIQQPHDERPEWADGLSTALLSERHGFYQSRLGQQYADEHRQPAAFAFEDLGWIGVDEEGEAIELDADPEHRMEVLGEVLGLDREEGTFKAGTVTEVEIAMDRERTGDEVAALEKAQETGFQEVRKDGTQG